MNAEALLTQIYHMEFADSFSSKAYDIVRGISKKIVEVSEDLEDDSNETISKFVAQILLEKKEEINNFSDEVEKNPFYKEHLSGQTNSIVDFQDKMMDKDKMDNKRKAVHIFTFTAKCASEDLSADGNMSVRDQIKMIINLMCVHKFLKNVE